MQEPLTPLSKFLCILALILLLLSSVFIGLFAGAQHKLNSRTGGDDGEGGSIPVRTVTLTVTATDVETSVRTSISTSMTTDIRTSISTDISTQTMTATSTEVHTKTIQIPVPAPTGSPPEQVHNAPITLLCIPLIS